MFPHPHDVGSLLLTKVSAFISEHYIFVVVHLLTLYSSHILKMNLVTIWGCGPSGEDYNYSYFPGCLGPVNGIKPLSEHVCVSIVSVINFLAEL